MSKWDDLEDRMKEYFRLDKAQTVPGSGNGKGEEDVIGETTITQCKYSETKNISILRKDIDRLIDASDLQKKTPLFVTENNGLTLLSIPSNIKAFAFMCHFIIATSIISFVRKSISKNDTKEIKKGYIKLLIRARTIMSALKNNLDDQIDELEDELNKE